MGIMYDLGIRLLGLAIFLGGLFHQKTRKRWKLQKAWKDLLPHGPVDLWMHCASLGEFDQGLPLLWEYRKTFPEARILVSFFSPSGYDHYAKRHHCADLVCVMPLDTPKNARYFIQHTQPKAAVFMKYEFWLNFISALDTAQVPCYSVAAVFRKKQVLFSFYGGVFRQGLRRVTQFFVQNEASLTLLKSIGIEQVTVVGDPRFDNVLLQKAQRSIRPTTSESMEKLRIICHNKRVLVVGSSWEKEEELVHECLEQLDFEILLIAPHNVDAAHVESLEFLMGEDCHRLSQLERYSHERVIIIDSIGLLQELYSLGTLAIVGGGFRGQLHNILEPAVYGLPIMFGPKFEKFPEAQGFLDAGIAVSFHDGPSLLKGIEFFMKSIENQQYKTLEYIDAHQGATKKIMAFLVNTDGHSVVPAN